MFVPKLQKIFVAVMFLPKTTFCIALLYLLFNIVLDVQNDSAAPCQLGPSFSDAFSITILVSTSLPRTMFVRPNFLKRGQSQTASGEAKSMWYVHCHICYLELRFMFETIPPHHVLLHFLAFQLPGSRWYR